MKKMSIGIIGLGFVGSAIKNAYDVNQIEVICRDPFKNFNASIEEIKQSKESVNFLIRILLILILVGVISNEQLSPV
jgi:transcription antitermination factor NusG